MKSYEPYKKILSQLPLVILGLGIIIRLKIFFENRSLFIDEANLARNVAEKSIGAFFSPLDYEQYAPPLLLVETKVLTWLFGVHDYTFRLIPLLAGLLSLLLLYGLLRRYKFSVLACLYGMALFSFSLLTIRYATEFKQYSGDAFMCLAGLWLWVEDRGEPWGKAKLGFWSVAGSIALWYSMPMTFILGGIGFSFLYDSKKTDWPKIVSVGISWLLSFAAYYFVVLRHDIGDSNLENHHATYFFNLCPFSLEALKANFDLLVLLFKTTTDKTTISVVFGIILFLLGLRDLFRKDKGLLMALVVPILLMIMASHFHLYSMIPRMTLFVLPLVILVMMFGLEWLWRRIPFFAKIIMVACITLSIVNKQGYKHLWMPMTFEEIKAALILIEDEKPIDTTLYVHAEAVPAFDFYTRLADRPYTIPNAYLSTWQEHPQQFGSTRNLPIWVLYSHTTDLLVEKQLRALQQTFKVSQMHKSPYVQLYVIDNQGQ